MDQQIKQQGNTILIVDFNTQEILKPIGAQFFSFEFNADTVQFVDSSHIREVTTINLSELYDGQGALLSTEALALAYLSSFQLGPAPGGAVDSVTGDGVDNTDPNNPVITYPTPTNIGLGNVDNTSDANKPVSTATQMAIDSAVVGLFDDKGNYNALTNTPDLDASPSGILKGDVYTTNVAGTFFTQPLEIGDVLRALQDNPTLLIHWAITQTNLDAPSIKSLYESNADTNAYTDADKNKTDFITVTQAVDLDTIESDTATNNAKKSAHVLYIFPNGTPVTQREKLVFTGNVNLADASNITYGPHTLVTIEDTTNTGEVTGTGALTLDPTAVSNKTLKSTLAGTEEILINDGGTLKKTTSQDIADLGAGAGFSIWRLAYANNSAETTGTSYDVVSDLIFGGTTALGIPTEIKALIEMTGATNMDIRIFDMSNSLVIVEKLGNVVNTPTIVDLGALSNLSTLQAVWQVQVKRTGGTGSSRARVHALQIT